MINIKYEGYSVYANGSIIAYDKIPIEFQISELTVNISFDKNPEINKQYISQNISDDKKKLILKFINFNNVNNVGSKKPLLIGNIGDKEVYLLYFVSSINKETNVSVFNYTWLIKDNYD